MTDYEQDRRVLWIKDPTPVSRFRRCLFPGLTATVFLVLIITLGASNMMMSNRLSSMEQSVSNLSIVIQSLNASLQQAQAVEVQRLQLAVENNQEQLTSVSEALRQLSVVDSLSRSVASLKCVLERITNNRSAGCCPSGWDHFGLDCFFFSSLSLSWNQSRFWCDKHEAQLLVVNDDKTWDFVTRRSGSELYWVGLSDWRTGRWEWINQTPYTMERRRWMPGRPDYGGGPGSKRCAHLRLMGRLSNQDCSARMRYMCHKHSIHV